MATLTLRDIDERVMTRMRRTAKKERRSLNSQFLAVLDRGLERTENPLKASEKARAAKQRAAWAELAGKWEGEFPPIERITFGRPDVIL